MSFKPIYRIQRLQPEAGDKLLIVERSGRIRLLPQPDGNFALPTVEAVPEVQDLQLPLLGTLNGQRCLGLCGKFDTVLPETADALDIRELLAMVDPDLKALLLRGKPFLEWLALQSFCSACGTMLDDHEQEEARICPKCGTCFFPKISPAVIVLIKRDDGKLLLAHNCKFRSKVYSLIAGFVEAGETAEDAVRREVREEVGLEIKNIQYKYSQSWPFPDSLMLGFTAEYASGQLSPDGEEIVDANFYSIDDLPPLPGKSSIARRIIDEYITEMKNK